jgi:hypothetical protein
MMHEDNASPSSSQMDIAASSPVPTKANANNHGRRRLKQQALDILEGNH